MEIARHWRRNDESYMAGGRPLFKIDIEEDHLKLKNMVKGREINLNHGSADGSHLDRWAVGFVDTMADWGFKEEVIWEAAVEVSEQMNGQGERFLGEIMAAME